MTTFIQQPSGFVFLWILFRKLMKTFIKRKKYIRTFHEDQKQVSTKNFLLKKTLEIFSAFSFHQFKTSIQFFIDFLFPFRLKAFQWLSYITWLKKSGLIYQIITFSCFYKFNLEDMLTNVLDSLLYHSNFSTFYFLRCCRSGVRFNRKIWVRIKMSINKHSNTGGRSCRVV